MCQDHTSNATVNATGYASSGASAVISGGSISRRGVDWSNSMCIENPLQKCFKLLSRGLEPISTPATVYEPGHFSTRSSTLVLVYHLRVSYCDRKNVQEPSNFFFHYQGDCARHFDCTILTQLSFSPCIYEYKCFFQYKCFNQNHTKCFIDLMPSICLVSSESPKAAREATEVGLEISILDKLTKEIKDLFSGN